MYDTVFTLIELKTSSMDRIGKLETTPLLTNLKKVDNKKLVQRKKERL